MVCRHITAATAATATATESGARYHGALIDVIGVVDDDGKQSSEFSEHRAMLLEVLNEIGDGSLH